MWDIALHLGTILINQSIDLISLGIVSLSLLFKVLSNGNIKLLKITMLHYVELVLLLRTQLTIELRHGRQLS